MLIADAHVHFHACFRRDPFFDAAWKNITGAAPASGEAILPYLLLTESPGMNYFQRWRDEAETASERWRVERTGEECSLRVVREDGVRMIVVAGRQIPTLERLEVLALGAAHEIPPGLPLQECLRRAKEYAPIVCVPWGFGKWWLGRGRAVREALERADPSTFALGDSVGRPRGRSAPHLFRVAADHGIRVLPGSDPFPVRRHEHRAGSLCFAVPGPVDLNRPMRRLVEAASDGAAVTVQGEHVGLVTFVRDQVGLRLARAGRRWRET